MKCYKVKIEGAVLLIASDDVNTYQEAQAYAKRMGYVPKNIEEYKHMVMHLHTDSKKGLNAPVFLEKFPRDSFLYECKKGE